jgi:hypothetical protein
MSGVEVIGLISGIITLLDAVATVSSTIKDAKGLPSAFRQVDRRLPLVRLILSEAEKLNLDERSWSAVKPAVEDCKGTVKRLKKIFDAVRPQGKIFRIKRYYNIVKTLGRGNEVEDLMKGILVDVQLLAGNQAIKAASGAQVDELAEAIKELSEIPPSVPKEVFEGSDDRNVQHVWGGRAFQNIVGGRNNTQTNYNAPVTQNYGEQRKFREDDDDEDEEEYDDDDDRA